MTDAGPGSLPSAIWRKSSHSSPTSNDCVEVATNLRGVVAVRDSKEPAGTPLVVSARQWREFLARVP